MELAFFKPAYKKRGIVKMLYDLAVTGGGLTGVAAAVAAAREGLRVILIEQYGFLGGAATNSLVNPFMNYWIKEQGQGGSFKYTDVNKGLFQTMLNRLCEMGALLENRVTFNEEILKILLDRLTAEHGVEVLFHSYLMEAQTEGGRLSEIAVANKSGTERCQAKFFLDATGDADLAALAGCPYHVGRKEDNLCQPMTLCFRIGNIDMKKYAENREKISVLYKQAQAKGAIKNPREDVLSFPHVADGMVHFNSTRVIKKSALNARELSLAEMEGREQAYELYLFLKENIEGFENSRLIMMAPRIGVRESRMIDGEYTLTVDDIAQCRKFPDSVARGSYGVDIHSPDGAGTIQHRLKDGDYYTIPYRALIPKGAANLLVAGRCISSTHEAQSAYRILPICCNMGEGAGYALSIAAREGCPVNMVNIDKLHELLDHYGCKY